MADTSRKRSRKSKLVPREDAVYEEDIELQVPATKLYKNMKQPEAITSVFKPTASNIESTTSNLEAPDVYNTDVLKKINASARNSTESDEASHRKFEINIEIESCDDEDDFGEEFPKKRSINSRSAGNQDVVKNPVRCSKTEEFNSRVISTQPIPLTLEAILKALDKLQTSTNIADKILNIFVRNTIGYEQRTKLVLSWLETQIQKTLHEWRTWQSRSFHRENPLFYKCYICTRSYWHLSEFHTHLSTNHADDTTLHISLEKYEMHEANIIAYHTRLVVIKDIYTPGLCYRCGKDYAAHEISCRFQGKYYKEEGCPRQFSSCTGLRNHYPTCTICNVQFKRFKCDICKSRFDTDGQLNDHLILSHFVRSDVPIMTRYTKCPCSERYEWKYLHNCSKNALGNNFECIHCLMSFPKTLLETHMNLSRQPYECEVCGLVMANSCLKYDHMLLHTDEFQVVKKCTACEGFNVFVNIDAANTHWELEHKIMDLRQNQNNFHKIFVPSSSIYLSLAELDSKEHESRVAEQEFESKDLESISEVRESISEVRESISEAQESDSEEQESDFEEKASLLDIVEHSVSEFGSKDFVMEDFKIKEEPEDSEDSTGLVIKEEPLDGADDQVYAEENESQNSEDQTIVKQEPVEEDFDEYDDLIKLNFNIEDLLVKEESRVVDEETQESEIDYEGVSDEVSQDSMLEPQIIITGERKTSKKLYRCTMCGFQARHKEYKQHLKYDCSQNSISHRNFKCSKCDTQFSSMKKFLYHFVHHGYPCMSCPECLKSFKSYTTLGQHLQSHIKRSFVRVKTITYAGDTTAKPDFQCKRCLVRIDATEFFDHWETHILGEGSHTDKVVSKVKNKKERAQMQESIIKECIARLYTHPKECNQCHRMFKRVNECKRHIIEHLLTDAYNHIHIHKELKCQICDSGFAVSDKYKQHMRDHASLPVYKCELCDRTFSDSSNFTKHKKVHNLKVIICDLCGKKFQSKLSLEKHLEKHNNTEPIPCTICKKIFYFESAYRRHVKNFHQKHMAEYRCVICGKRFPSLKFKWDHMWEVHRQRKQKADCPICHQSFRKYSDVRAHARSVHLMSITVMSVKNAKPQTENKNREIVLSKLSSSSVPKITVGAETETLVIYDSD